MVPPGGHGFVRCTCSGGFVVFVVGWLVPQGGMKIRGSRVKHRLKSELYKVN